MSNVLLRRVVCAGAAALVGLAFMGGSAHAASGHPGSGGATQHASFEPGVAGKSSPRAGRTGSGGGYCLMAYSLFSVMT